MSDSRAKVRMYRQGLGDCFLLSFPRSGKDPFYVVIDCGVILGTADPATIMGKVVQDIFDTTKGHLDLLVCTHEHWDHNSGMIQARDLWKKFKVDEVWVGWTEDPNDALAKQLGGERLKMRNALGAAANRMRLAGSPDAAEEVEGMLDFFGAAGGNSTADALAIVKGLSKTVRFCLPQDAPVTLDGTNVRAYVLGPPHDEKFIKKYNPSTKAPETYGMDSDGVFLDAVTMAPGDDDPNAPFGDKFQIPLEAAKQLAFFKAAYWGEDADSTEKDQSWRRIDGSWLDAASSLALQLDSATNNTSVVLAFELDGGDVLLFPADAQVGNWLSWQTLSWKVDGKTVTAPDLLHRVLFYKVGHHGSHNATLRELGLEEMTGLKYAFIPVDQKMAAKKHWGAMPFTDLLTRLDQITNHCVVRIDQAVPDAMSKLVVSKDLYYEMSL